MILSKFPVTTSRNTYKVDVELTSHFPYNEHSVNVYSIKEVPVLKIKYRKMVISRLVSGCLNSVYAAESVIKDFEDRLAREEDGCAKERSAWSEWDGKINE